MKKEESACFWYRLWQQDFWPDAAALEAAQEAEILETEIRQRAPQLPVQETQLQKTAAPAMEMAAGQAPMSR